nr:hypothetical protein L203_04971 [Cryptococcus depauperatus CBS 7841]
MQVLVTTRSSRFNRFPPEQKPTGLTNRKPFQITRQTGEIYKPWLEKQNSALSIVNAVQIVRPIINHSASNKYGKVGVTTKFPLSDWWWSRIMSLLVDETFGKWP